MPSYPLDLAASDINVHEADEMLTLIEAAYDDLDRIRADRSWDWEKDGQRLPPHDEFICRLGFASYWMLLRRRLPFGLVLRRGERLIIVFRGTRKPQEWISNLKIKQVPFLDDPRLGEVHRGFHAHYTREDRGGFTWFDFRRGNDRPSMRSVIEHIVSQRSGNSAAVTPGEGEGARGMGDGATASLESAAGTGDASPIQDVVIAGHSLGAALATLTAAHIAGTFPHLPIRYYAFGSPRVGDATFADRLKASTNIKCYRISNSEDRVPTLPWSNLLVQAVLRSRALEERYTWTHVGRPLYFTCQRGSPIENHSIAVHRDALRGQPAAPPQTSLTPPPTTMPPAGGSLPA